MIDLSIRHLKAGWRRSLAVFISVVLGVAFVTSAMLVGGLYENSLRNTMGDQVRGADIVIVPENGPVPVTEISNQPNVDGVEQRQYAVGELLIGATQSITYIGTTPKLEEVKSSIDLEEGRWPTAPTEIVLGAPQIDESGLAVGDSVTWRSMEGAEQHTFVIVGVAPGSSSVAMSLLDAYVTPETLSSLGPQESPFGVLVTLASGVNENQSVNEIQAIIGDSGVARSFDGFVDFAVDYYAGGSLAIQIIALGFAIISMFAAGIVIANSFEISVSQRVKDLGLLRSIGTTASQVRRMVLTESAIIGTVASIIGVVTGVSVMTLAGQLIFEDGGSVKISLLGVALPFILGIIVTVISAMSSARAATRVHPLQAIRQSEAPVESNQISRKKKLLALAMFVGGFLVLLGSVASTRFIETSTGIPMLIGILGGAVSFLGLLQGAQFYVPAMASWLKSTFQHRFGISGELALTNLNRNPRRAASTSAALLMGVTLVTMMAVGVSVTKATLINVANEENPIDLVLEVTDAGSGTEVIDPESISRWREIDGVQSLTETASVNLTWPNGEEFVASSVDLDAADEVLRSETLDDLDGNTIVVDTNLSTQMGLEDGDTISLAGNRGSSSVTVIVDDSLGSGPIMFDATAREIATVGPVTGAWIRIEDSASVGDVMDVVRDGIAPGTTLDVSGNAASRENLIDMLDTLVVIAMSLLGVSVLIALVGIGNTLTLSVIERTRETGMLRAMGLLRGQVRKMLVVEGVLLSVLGCIVGILLGTAYGVVGVYNIAGTTFTVSIELPWIWFVGIMVAAILCGVIASIQPTRRSLAIQPVEALSHQG